MDIGTTIRKLRLQKGLTQEQLADAVGVTMQTISRWETSVNYPDIIMLPLLAGLFNVTTDYLLNVGGGTTMKTIESKRLIIREWHESDAAGLLELNQSPNGLAMPWKIDKNIGDSLETIRIWKKYQEMYPVILKEKNKLIGVVGIVDVNRNKQYKEIEFIITDDYQNNGYTTEAIKLILSYAFGELDLVIAAASIDSADIDSIHVIEECGFTCEGTLRKYGRDLSDRVRYSITKEEYESL